MKCKTASTMLAALIDGELTPAEAARVRRHLADCAACNEAATETARVQQLAGAWITTGSDVWEGVRAEIETPDLGTLVASHRALEAEVRALRAEVAGLRARTGWAYRGGVPTSLIERTPASEVRHRCLRIV